MPTRREFLTAALLLPAIARGASRNAAEADLLPPPDNQNGWRLSVEAGAEGTSAVEGKALKVRIASTDGHPWLVTLSPASAPSLTAGKRYTLRVRARSDTPGEIKVRWRTEEERVERLLLRVFPQELKFTFDAAGGPLDLALDCGSRPRTVWFETIRLDLAEPGTEPGRATAVTLFDFEGSAPLDGWTFEGDIPQVVQDSTFFRGKVTGFSGHYYTTLDAHSMRTGTALSPAFLLEKPFLCLQIGGGDYPRETCVNLRADEKTVRAETGFGSADLQPQSMDISGLQGKTARLEVVDNVRDAPHGYVMLDTVALSEKPNTGYQALLERSLRRIRKQYEVPALYAVVYYGGKIVGIGCDGVRKLGDPAPAQSTDKVLMASISKPIAATVLAALIDRGVLRWNTTLPEAFPGLASVILPEFQAVTLADLLCHRSGLSTDAVYRGKLPSANQPTQWRSAGVRNALTQPPQFPPKTRREYSNSGFIVAATMAESITGIPWESLAHHYLYDPAGMESVGFGRAISPFDVDQPIGHVRRDEKIVPENDNLMWVKAAPSGQVHCDMFDVVRFARIHIDGPAGRSSIASARTFREMHTPLFDAEQSLGFWFKKTERAYTLTHGGIVGGTGSWIQVEPANGLAIFVFHNYWSDRKIGNSTEGDAIRGSLTEALRADLGIR